MPKVEGVRHIHTRLGLTILLALLFQELLKHDHLAVTGHVLLMLLGLSLEHLSLFLYTLLGLFSSDALLLH